MTCLINRSEREEESKERVRETKKLNWKKGIVYIVRYRY